jgi:hypothetical protein
VSHCSVKLRAAAIFLGIVIAGGCAAPREAVKPEKRKPESPVSVRLPVMTPMKVEPPAASPGAEPTITHTDVAEGNARSLNMIEFHYNRGKPGPPVEDNATSPEDTTPDVEKP